VCESDCPQERQTRDPTGYTQTSSGTCTEKRSRAACSDTTDLDLDSPKIIKELQGIDISIWAYKSK
jgi:hypothetical protein